LAFDTPELVETGKAAILITSFAAAVIGSLAIYLTTRNKEQTK
jgi:Na+/H+ antiporter NhaA